MEKYNQLTKHERDQLAVLRNRGKSFREIAAVLGRSASTLCRELKRNLSRHWGYLPHKAEERAVQRKQTGHKRMRLKSHALRLEVERLLMLGWSPELIAGRLSLNPQFPSISYEAIYQWVYTEAPHLIGCLVRHHPSRWPKGKARRKRKLTIPQRISIQDRPQIINDRLQPGHWETDLLIGKGVSAVQVSVERQTRFTKLKKIHRKTALAFRLALSQSLSSFPSHLKRSITYDNGSENVEHHILNQQIGSSSYFCEPYHSWEKGSVENTNGLIRRFLPKKTNFDTISDTQIQQVETWLNDRPRKCLNFKTPTESLMPLCCT